MIVSDRLQGRGIEFISINVTPYKYYPKYKRLEVYTEIDIQAIETGENPDHELNQPKRSHIFDELYLIDVYCTLPISYQLFPQFKWPDPSFFLRISRIG